MQELTSANDNRMITKGILKKSRSGQGHKRSPINKSYKYAVQQMLPSSFCTQTSMVTVIDPMASSNLTLDGGQVKVKSNKVKSLNQYFYIKGTYFVFRIFSGFQICHLFSSAMR